MKVSGSSRKNSKYKNIHVMIHMGIFFIRKGKEIVNVESIVFDNISSVKAKLRMQMEFRLRSVRVGNGEQGNEREAICLLDISNDNGAWLSIVR